MSKIIRIGPAVRQLSEADVVSLCDNALDYIERARRHKTLLERVGCRRAPSCASSLATTHR
jgi:hypothetical protein